MPSMGNECRRNKARQAKKNYLLQKYFGSDGREEANELLKRQSGSEDSPRMLGAFNETTPDWLSFFMFTSFTDRDGKACLINFSLFLLSMK